MKETVISVLLLNFYCKSFNYNTKTPIFQHCYNIICP